MRIIVEVHFASSRDGRARRAYRVSIGRRGPDRSELILKALREARPGIALVNLISSYELPGLPARAAPPWLSGFLHHPQADRLAVLRATVSGEVRSNSAYVESARKLLVNCLGMDLPQNFRTRITARRMSEVYTTRLKTVAPAVGKVWSVALFGRTGVPVTVQSPALAPPVDGWARLAKMLAEEGENAKDDCMQLLDVLLNEHAARFIIDPLNDFLLRPTEPPSKDPVAIFKAALGTDGACKPAKLVDLTLPRPTLSLPTKYRGCIALAMRDGEGLPALQALFKLVVNEADFAVEARCKVVLGVRQRLLEKFGASLSDMEKRTKIQCRTSEASRVREKNRGPPMLSFLEDALSLPSSTGE